MKKYQITKQLRVDNGLGFEGCAEEDILLETPDKEKALETFRHFRNYYIEMIKSEAECKTHRKYMFYFLVEIDEDDNYTDLDWFVIGGNN